MMTSRFLVPSVLSILVVACGGETVNVGSTSQLELQKKADGSPTGNGQTCSWDDPVSSNGPASPAPNGPYKIGDRFPSPDGCNTCECTTEGIGCTEMACQPQEPKACTEEAKLCADGKTTVVRQGPSCEFEPCPGETNCNPVACNLACESGFKKGADGCEICACNEPVACPADAKLCPDGKTYVSRTGPNCAFAPCP